MPYLRLILLVFLGFAALIAHPPASWARILGERDQGLTDRDVFRQMQAEEYHPGGLFSGVGNVFCGARKGTAFLARNWAGRIRLISATHVVRDEDSAPPRPGAKQDACFFVPFRILMDNRDSPPERDPARYKACERELKALQKQQNNRDDAWTHWQSCLWGKGRAFPVKQARVFYSSRKNPMNDIAVMELESYPDPRKFLALPLRALDEATIAVEESATPTAIRVPQNTKTRIGREIYHIYVGGNGGSQYDLRVGENCALYPRAWLDASFRRSLHGDLLPISCDVVPGFSGGPVIMQNQANPHDVIVSCVAVAHQALRGAVNTRFNRAASVNLCALIDEDFMQFFGRR